MRSKLVLEKIIDVMTQFSIAEQTQAVHEIAKRLLDDVIQFNNLEMKEQSEKVFLLRKTILQYFNAPFPFNVFEMSFNKAI